MQRGIRLRQVVLAALTSLAVSTAAAQGDAGSDEAALVEKARSKNRLLEEVVVTAQRREESVQDVPIAIAAFSSDKLDALGVTKADDLAAVVPGLTFTQTAGFSVVYLRGVGTEAFLPGADQTVPQYIDGVNLLAAQGVQNLLGRVQRVEVLKGPQGTLFGRNSTGGAINIVTATPDPAEFFGDVALEAGNYDTYNQKFYLNIPVLDNLAIGLAGFNQSHEAYYKNSNITGKLLDEETAKGGFAKILWQATDNLSLTLSGQFSESETVGTLVTENIRPAPVFSAVIPRDKADRRIDQDIPGGSEVESYLLSAILEWNLDWFDLKVIGSDQELDVPFNQLDFDTSALPIVGFSVPDQYAEQETVEIQFISNDGSFMSDRLEWIVGGFYLNSAGGFERLDLQIIEGGLLPVVAGQTGLGLQEQFNDLLVGAGLPPILNGRTNASAGGVIHSDSVSVYAQATYDLTSDIKLTLGGRYQREGRGVRRSRVGAISPFDDETEVILLSFNPPDLEANQFAPKVSLQWFADEVTQIYTSYSRGYQSPTYNAVNFFSEPDPVDEVIVDAYELGIKTQLLESTLNLEAAVFYTDQTDVTVANVSLTSGGVVRFDNAAGSQIQGAEMSFLWNPFENNPGLVFTGGASYLDTEYTDYEDGRGFDEDTGLSFGPSSQLPARDFTGNEMPRAPEFTYTLGVNQHVDVKSGWFEFGLDTYYNAGFFFSAQNSDLYANDEYQLYNVRLSYFNEPSSLQFTGYIRNLLEEEYYTQMFLADFGPAVTLNAPRAYGAEIKWTF